jgi:3-phenylpropionate/trans-cinnamate dioxygenase ferredoxin subunit
MIRFVRVANAAEVPSDRARPVFVDGKVVALFKVDGAIHALDDSCPHAGSSLSAGKLEGAFVQCRGHGLRFDVRTGRMRGVDGYCAKTYPVRVTDGEVAIGIDCGNPLNRRRCRNRARRARSSWLGVESCSPQLVRSDCLSVETCVQ